MCFMINSSIKMTMNQTSSNRMRTLLQYDFLLKFTLPQINTLISQKVTIFTSFCFLLLHQRFFLERPINFNFLIINFLPIHFLYGSLRFLKISIFDQSISFGVSCLSIHIQMQTFNFPKFRKRIENIILLRLLVKICCDQYPSFNSCIIFALHFIGCRDYLGIWSVMVRTIIKLGRNYWRKWNG